MATLSEHEVEDWQTAYNNAKTPAECEQALRDYESAKLRNAERREQARFDRAIKRSEKRKATYKKICSTIKNFFQKTK